MDEQGAKKALNTPGASEMLPSLGGPAGLPFFAFLDSRGVLIVNSLRPDANGKPANIGHPYEPSEVDWFMAMLAKAAPAMTANERKSLEQFLRAQKKGG